MERTKAAEVTFLQVLEAQRDQGGEPMLAVQIMMEAQRIPIRVPPILYRIGHAAYILAGRERRPYNPHYGTLTEETLKRLVEKGVVLARPEDGPREPGHSTKLVYWLPPVESDSPGT